MLPTYVCMHVCIYVYVCLCVCDAMRSASVASPNVLFAHSH